MKYYVLIFIVFTCCFWTQVQGQEGNYFVTAEFFLGKTLPSNTGYPETKNQTAFFLSLGTFNNDAESEWMKRLGFPKTGIALGITDLGNSEFIGQTYTLLPYAEFSVLQKKTDRLHLNVGLGATYVTHQFDFEGNRFNRSTTTKINWAFRSFVYYDIWQANGVDWRLGAGYSHFSNGHTGLPNQGSNSFLLSLSALVHNENKISNQNVAKPFEKKKSLYFTSRLGLGYNVLTRDINDAREVYSAAFSVEKYLSPVLKYGGGFYLRNYQHFYDYIVDEGELINEEYSHFKDNPFLYSSNFGVFVSGELLLGHFGLEIDLGLNIFKPFYEIEWQIQNNDYSGTPQPLQPLDDYFKLKRTVTSRLGLKYYIFDTSKFPKHNVFLSGHINANLGQADFSELSLGYMYRLDK